MIGLERKLIEGKWITPEELFKAKEDQEKRNKSIFCSLAMLGYMSEEDIFKFFALNTNIPFVKLSDYKISKDVLGIIREDFCRDNLIMPLFKIGRNLFVAMANPLDTDLIANISGSTGLDAYGLLSSASDITAAINRYFGYPDSFFAVDNLIFEPQSVSNFPFYRASERKRVSVSVKIIIKDERVSLSLGRVIPAVVVDISSEGTAFGAKAAFFIPQDTLLAVSIPRGETPESVDIDVKVVHCRMNKPGEFFMGLKVLSKDRNIINYLKSLALQNL